MTWDMQEAAHRFEELVRRTIEEGPQVVTRHGEESVVFVAADEYRESQTKDGERTAAPVVNPREPPLA